MALFICFKGCVLVLEMIESCVLCFSPLIMAAIAEPSILVKRRVRNGERDIRPEVFVLADDKLDTRTQYEFRITDLNITLDSITSIPRDTTMMAGMLMDDMPFCTDNEVWAEMLASCRSSAPRAQIEESTVGAIGYAIHRILGHASVDEVFDEMIRTLQNDHGDHDTDNRNACWLCVRRARHAKDMVFKSAGLFRADMPDHIRHVWSNRDGS